MRKFAHEKLANEPVMARDMQAVTIPACIDDPMVLMGFMNLDFDNAVEVSSFLQKSDVPQVIRDLVLRGLASRAAEV